MLVRDIMTKDIESCTPDTSIHDAACQLVECDCGSLPVVDSHRTRTLVGMITDRDIVSRCVALGLDPQTTTVGDCMSRDIETVLPDTELAECCRRLEVRQVRRIPVVDAEDRCCGMVSQADLARHLGSDALAMVVREVSEPTSEASSARTR